MSRIQEALTGENLNTFTEKSKQNTAAPTRRNHSGTKVFTIRECPFLEINKNAPIYTAKIKKVEKFYFPYCWVPVITMLTPKLESDPAFEEAVSVRVAHVLAPGAKLVVAGVQDTLKYDPALDGVQEPVVPIDKVSGIFPVFFM